LARTLAVTPGPGEPAAGAPGVGRVGNVLLVALVTTLRTAGPQAGSPGMCRDLLAGLAGAVAGAAARSSWAPRGR